MNYPCIQCDTREKPCPDCLVPKLGHRKEMEKAMKRIIKKINEELRSRTPDERDDFFSEVAMHIIKSVETYDGRNGASFATWAINIANRRVQDFYRRTSRRRPEGGFCELPGELAIASAEHAQLDVCSLLKELEIHAEDKKSKCLQLIVQLYDAFKRDTSQKDLAEVLGLKPNTLNQSIKRCREWIARHCPTL